MRLVVSTSNVNCYLALSQSCKSYNVECIKYTSELQILPTDVVLYMESNPLPLHKTLKCHVINSDYLDCDKNSKYIQYLEVRKHGIECIPTYTLGEIKHSYLIDVVSKPMRGSMGHNVKIIAASTANSETDIYQPIINNDGDWRIIVVNNKAVSMIKRKGSGFLNNIAQGADAWTEWDATAAKLAEDSARALEIEYAGIDIIKCSDTGKYYFLECNSIPTFDSSQILTRIDIAGEIVKYVIEKYGIII